MRASPLMSMYDHLGQASYEVRVRGTAQPATGSITFTANPAPGTTMVLNGTTWTFVSALTTGNQILIGATLGATLASAVSALQASTDANTKKFIYLAFSNVLLLTAATGGSAGNALTISTTVSGATASGTTLSGGPPRPPIYLWGSAGIKPKNIIFDKPLLLHIRNDVFGEEITFGTQVASGTQTTMGTLQPGECVSIPLQDISGVFATCVLESNVACLIKGTS